MISLAGGNGERSHLCSKFVQMVTDLESVNVRQQSRNSQLRINKLNNSLGWEVPDLPLRQRNSTKRDRWDKEIGVETGRGASKETRSFLSQCAVAFLNDVLTDTYPPVPPVLEKQIREAGGTKRWIISDFTRLNHFENFYKRRAVT